MHHVTDVAEHAFLLLTSSITCFQQKLLGLTITSLCDTHALMFWLILVRKSYSQQNFLKAKACL